MLSKPLRSRPVHPALPPAQATMVVARLVAAVALQAASRLLQRLACRLVATPTELHAQVPLPMLEFHAEAGAPEGALYVDGQWVANLPGVRRL